MAYIEVNTRIAGIPAIAAVNYQPPMRGNLETPPEPEEWDIEILDTHGRQAVWLAQKLDDDTLENIKSQAAAEMEFVRYEWRM